MSWPPKVGVLLPRADQAIGVREKLVRYALDRTHEHGGAKARGFEQILGITLDDADYLEEEIRAKILSNPIQGVRSAKFSGYNCVVEIPIRGLGRRRGRLISVRTVWFLANAGDRPRLTTVFPKP
jgi:filamentous hemagglutinin